MAYGNSMDAAMNAQDCGRRSRLSYKRALTKSRRMEVKAEVNAEVDDFLLDSNPGLPPKPYVGTFPLTALCHDPAAERRARFELGLEDSDCLWLYIRRAWAEIDSEYERLAWAEAGWGTERDRPEYANLMEPEWA